MTTQIDVVEINDNTNDNSNDSSVEEVKHEEVKPNAQAKPRNGRGSKTPTLNSTECCLQAKAKAEVK